MVHCPQCGKPCADTVGSCPVCGLALQDPGAVDPPRGPARTMMGVAPVRLGDALSGASPEAGATPAARTLVGMPLVGPLGAPELSPENRTMLGGITPLGTGNDDGPTPGVKTVVGVVGPTAAIARGQAPVPVEAQSREAEVVVPEGARTMIGVAMPGIAPLNPGGAQDDYEPPPELGATMAPRDVRRPRPREEEAPQQIAVAGERGTRAARSLRPRPTPKRALVIVGAAAALAVFAVVFALVWPSAPPLRAQARVDGEGREVVEVRCASCPDGTKLSIATGAATILGSATVEGEIGTVIMGTPLAVGDNLLRVSVDRPAGGRDETVNVRLHIGYRIRPDLSSLSAERPAIQIVAEAVAGTSIELDGKPMNLINGRATEIVDVTDACSGPSDETTTLTRQVPYVVKPADGPTEQGTVNVSVRVLPLRIDAPGTHAVTDGKSFTLAGRTLRGAEILAAGRPIPVQPDGSFAQTMNVSSVGATQIEVRARMAGAAPRLTKIAVRRVDSLETAAREFVAQTPPPVGYGVIVKDIAGSAGKATVLAGEVIEARIQTHQTVMLLDVSPKSGCDRKEARACQVRLIQGARSTVGRGDLITAYGRVVRPFTVAGKPDIPEVHVDFTLKGLR